MINLNKINTKNEGGISLISLIITIIVIIILAAIVIYTGLNTPDRANYAKFVQDVDNVQTAVYNKFGDLKTKHALEKNSRTDEQIYLEIATGKDNGMNSFMCTNGTSYNSTEDASTGVQNITPSGEKLLGIKLPKVRESTTSWYIDKNGTVFNATGYVDGGKTYFNSKMYYDGELPVSGPINNNAGGQTGGTSTGGSSSTAETSNSGRAETIYSAIVEKKVIVGSSNGNSGDGEEENVVTLGEKFEDNWIGKTINYTADNGESEWIILCQDESNDVLITTKNPVGTYTSEWGAENVDKHLPALQAICNAYTGKIGTKNRTVKEVRSIKRSDITAAVDNVSDTNKDIIVADKSEYWVADLSYYGDPVSEIRASYINANSYLNSKWIKEQVLNSTIQYSGTQTHTCKLRPVVVLSADMPYDEVKDLIGSRVSYSSGYDAGSGYGGSGYNSGYDSGL